MKQKLFGMLFVLTFMFGITDTLIPRSWTNGVQFINIPGVEIMKNRSVQSEGAFGILKEDYGFDCLSRQGETIET